MAQAQANEQAWNAAKNRIYGAAVRLFDKDKELVPSCFLCCKLQTILPNTKCNAKSSVSLHAVGMMRAGK